MISFSRTIAIATLLGLSSFANASTVNLQGNLNIEGFNPLFDDNNGRTYALHLSDLNGSVLLDSTPITSINGSLTLDALGTSSIPNIVNPVLSLINVGFSALPSSVFGVPFNFGPGFPGTVSQTVNNVTIPGAGVTFSEVQVVGSGNSLDIFFTEITSTGFGLLMAADATLPEVSLRNNGSITSGFDLQSSTVSAVPVPAAVWLMGSGLAGLLGFSRKKTA
ncbi:MAG: VPLPA-CTERM sorting domain-containing protein [Methylococcales bacterium]|nr:VPLPA-CTERM sorting domain-containing protein [Methylococcales bacterium]